MPKAEAAPRRLPHEYRSGADVFKALGNPSRLLIVDELTHGERCVADLTALIGSDISTVSKHLAVLRNAGLVVDDRRGQQVFYRLGASCVAKSVFKKSYGGHVSVGVMTISTDVDKLYDTDLTDAAWALIAPMLPPARPGGRPRKINIRAVLNAIFYLLRTGCQWRLLPREFPGWSRSITTSEPGRTLVSGLVSSARCTTKLDGKAAGPPVPQSSLWTVSR